MSVSQTRSDINIVSILFLVSESLFHFSAGPEDVFSPVQVIMVNGTWITRTGEELSQICQDQYYNSLRQSASEVSYHAVMACLGCRVV